MPGASRALPPLPGLSYPNPGLEARVSDFSRQHDITSETLSSAGHPPRGHLADSPYEEHRPSPSQFDRISRLVSRSPSGSSSVSLHRSNSKGSKSDKGKEDVDKRRSQFADIPLLEMQLIPSLRDTVDRMTHPPKPVVRDAEDREGWSKEANASGVLRKPRQPAPGRSPSVPPKYLSPSQTPSFTSTSTFSTLGRAAMSPSRTVSPRLASASSPNPTGTPRATLSVEEASQPILKSALRTNQSSTATSSSSAIVQSRRKSLRTVKPMVSKSPNTFVTRDFDQPPTTSTISKAGSRPRTGEEALPQDRSKSLLPVPKSKAKSNPNTPQDTKKFPSFATPQSTNVTTFSPRLSPLPPSNLPRPAFSSASANDSGSDLERRLGSIRASKVAVSTTNAIPSSSESESDGEAAKTMNPVRSPISNWKSGILARDRWRPSSPSHWQGQHPRPSAVHERSPIGLGLQLSSQIQAAQGSVAVESEAEDGASVYEDSDATQGPRRDALEQYGDEDASVYDDDAAGNDAHASPEDFHSTPVQEYADSRDEALTRKQAALVGIVDNLRVDYRTHTSYGRNSIRNSGLSNYAYAEGLAITISDDSSVRAVQTLPVAKRQRTQQAAQQKWAIPSSSPPVVPRKPSSRSRQSRYLPQSASPSEEIRQHTTGSRSISQNSTTRRSRHEGAFVPTDDPKANWHGQDEHVSWIGDEGLVNTADGEVDMLTDREDVAERERAAFGIPASLSYGANSSSQGSPSEREVQTLQCRNVTNGRASTSSGDDSWKVRYREDELSRGAEALFERLTVHDNGRSNYHGHMMTTPQAPVQETPHSRTELRSGDDRVRSNSVDSISITVTSSAPSIYEEGPSEDQASLPAPTATSWRSMLQPSTYDSLAAYYGPTEMRRQQLVYELFTTEQDFVKHMRTVIPSFILPLRRRDSRAWLDGVPEKVAKLFDWLEDIVNFHSGISRALRNATNLWASGAIVERVAEPLRKHMSGLEVYQPYLMRVDEVREMVADCVRDSGNVFGEYVQMWEREGAHEGTTLQHLLERPINRVLVYPETFQRLLELTPRRHPDHFYEVRIREEEYEFVKDMASRLEGLGSPAALARRERRLLHHGELHWVLSRDVLNHEINSLKLPSKDGAGRLALPNEKTPDGSQRTSRLASAIHNWHVRQGSVGSTASSTSSLRSYGTVSDASIAIASVAGDSHRTLHALRSPVGGEIPSGQRRKERQDKLPNVLPVQAFIFADLLLLATHATAQSVRTPSDRAENKWRLLDDTGIARVVSITMEHEDGGEVSLKSLILHESDRSAGHGRVVILDLFPMGIDQINSGGIPHSNQPVEMRLIIPPSTEDSEGLWLKALDGTCRSTIHSISFPPLSGTTHGTNVDLELDTRQSVMAIMSSGLPMPKSPSMQLEHAAAYKNEPTQQEREERGWWSLRFQQVLREMQRQDQNIIRPPDARGKYSLA
ncbi:hypothetical protein BKA93DRAFT_754489 [Sparassis latifolia]